MRSKTFAGGNGYGHSERRRSASLQRHRTGAAKFVRRLPLGQSKQRYGTPARLCECTQPVWKYYDWVFIGKEILAELNTWNWILNTLHRCVKKLLNWFRVDTLPNRRSSILYRIIMTSQALWNFFDVRFQKFTQCACNCLIGDVITIENAWYATWKRVYCN